MYASAGCSTILHVVDIISILLDIIIRLLVSPYINQLHVSSMKYPRQLSYKEKKKAYLAPVLEVPV
jgi:hypothetical protein